MKQISRIFFIFIALSLISSCNTSNTDDNADNYNDLNKYLNMLDEAVANVDKYRTIKEEHLAQLKMEINTATDSATASTAEMQLASAYSDYQLDSALVHIKRAIAVAPNQQLKLHATVSLAYLYNNTGVMYKEAHDMLTKLRPQIMADSTQWFDYYCLGLQVYRNMAAHCLDDSLRRHYEQLRYQWRDSALSIQHDNDILLANHMIDNGQYNRAAEMLLRNLSDTPSTERGAAVSYNQLATIYGHQGFTERQAYYLTLSAICDMKGGVREYLSLQALASLLNKLGDHERAYAYIKRSVADATEAGAKLRMLEISEVMPVIDAAYTEMQADRRRSLISAIAIITLLVVVLIFLLLIVRKRNKLLHRANAEAKAAASQLEASNRIKEEYVTRFMNLSLEYLARMENYRGHLNKIAGKRDLELLISTIRSTRYVNQEIDYFYECFDNAFLHLYPNFVNDFNSLIREEERIYDLQPGRLNTLLRIFALNRMGITETESICRFLRCSTSTIYNSRSRMRRAATDRNKFDATFPTYT